MDDAMRDRFNAVALDCAERAGSIARGDDHSTSLDDAVGLAQAATSLVLHASPAMPGYGSEADDFDAEIVWPFELSQLPPYPYDTRALDREGLEPVLRVQWGTRHKQAEKERA